MTSVFGFTVRLILFFLTFSLEIKIHASADHSKSSEKTETSESGVSGEHFLQEPNLCVPQKVYPCAVKNRLRKPRALHWNGVSLGIGGGSSVVLQEEGTVRLVFGDFVVQAQDDLKLKTEFANIDLRVLKSQSPMAMTFIQKNWKEVRAVSMNGEVVLKPFGREEMIVTRGFETRITSVSSRGRAGIEIPAPFHFKSLLKKISPYFPDRERFKTEMSEVQKAWATSVASTGDWYLSLIDRQIASARDEEERKRLARERIRKENDELRQLFRQRNHYQ